MRTYLGGPTRGMPNYNKAAFVKGANVLRALGHEVFSPLEHDQDNGLDFGGGDIRISLKADLDWICDKAEQLVMLPGWEVSKGTQAEVWTARAIGLKTLPIETFSAWHNHD